MTTSYLKYWECKGCGYKISNLDWTKCKVTPKCPRCSQHSQPGFKPNFKELENAR